MGSVWLANILRFMILSIALLGASTWMFRSQVVADTSELACDSTEIFVSSVHRCLKSKEAFKDCPQCPEMVVLPAGEFQMGSAVQEATRSSSEGPQHLVTIKRPFAVGKYEVTFAEWDACVVDGGCSHNPRDSGWGRNSWPVINVSWDDVVKEYLPWISKKAGQRYRLLTESEWEYAARAGTTSPFATGSTITADVANFDGTNIYGGSAKGDYRKRTVEVGSFPSNAFGLHDMHGNVWEWVGDCYVDAYINAPSAGSAAAETPGCPRVMRGGSWIDSPRVLRSANRGFVPPNTRFIYRGFRVGKSL